MIVAPPHIVTTPAVSPVTGDADGETIPDLAWAILLTVSYSDLFDYPLQIPEVRRYLVGRTATDEEIEEVLASDRRLRGYLTRDRGFLCLAGRVGLAGKRLRRRANADRLWPSAVRYGKLIAGLPFVRMVGLTGALALRNVDESDDIDYFIVTETRRLWLTRALVIGVVRTAARLGVRLCPNYLLTERALSLNDRNLFAARELTQMVPLAGAVAYDALRRANQSWVSRYLPNADGVPPSPHPLEPIEAGRLRGVAEAVLQRSWADPLENWEANRKMRRLSAGLQFDRRGEVQYGRDWCKGHTQGYGTRTLRTYAARVEDLARQWS